MNWLMNRLKEKSTWLAIFTLAGLIGMKINPELQELITQAILAVAAIVAFVFRENTHERSTDAGPTALPPIQLVGKSDSLQSDSVHDGDAPARFYRRTDDVLRNPVSSPSGFQPPAERRQGVGWNDE